MRPARDLIVRHRALVITVFSFLAWGSILLTHEPAHPFGDLSHGGFTDHFSHMNTARLFTHAGINIWRKPLQDSGIALTQAQRAALPKDIAQSTNQIDVLAVPGWPIDKPFISSWSSRPRFHPAGDMVITAPIALAYSYSKLSFTWANRLLILLFLLYVHISIFFLFRGGIEITALNPTGLIVIVAVYLEIIHWALEGFYEGLVLAPLIVCGRYLQQRKALPAIFAFMIAANLHFRSYFFLPMLAYALLILIREEQWRSWKKGEYVLAAGTGILAFTSFGVFGLLWPWLKGIPNSNAVNITAHIPHGPAATLIIVGTIIAALLLYSGARFDALLVAWFCIMMLFLREAFRWDVLTLLAWLAIPIISSKTKSVLLIRDLRIIAIIFFAVFVFHNSSLLAPTWLPRVVL
ncbi:MAG: hypothetical protein ACYDCC_06505 [Actinomycetota bacterium]